MVLRTTIDKIRIPVRGIRVLSMVLLSEMFTGAHSIESQYIDTTYERST